jgi:hypothetical protein
MPPEQFPTPVKKLPEKSPIESSGDIFLHSAGDQW